MREQVTMPQLGETVSEGTVTKWLRKRGDSIAADQPLVEIQTDKVSMEVPSLRAGVLAEILVDEGQTVPVGAALAWLEIEGGGATEASAGQPPEQSAAFPAETPQPAGAADAGTAPAAPPEARRPSPLIRRLLGEAGLSAGEVTGSGPGGRIRREDVAAAVAAREEAPPRTASAQATPAPAALPPRGGGHTEPLSRLRMVIASRMVASLQTSAQLTTVVEVDVTHIAGLRARANANGGTNGVRLSFLPFFARTAIEALGAEPDVNASVDTDLGTVTRYDAVHLGIAVDTDAGLLVPVVRDAGRLSIVGLAAAIADVAERTRTKRISPDELSGGTFTLTNTGSRGALFDTPIINAPQVAILGTGAVVRRPTVVVDPVEGSEGIAVRSMVYLALTYDHRLVDGAMAARFLVGMKTRLEQGGFEADLGLSKL